MKHSLEFQPDGFESQQDLHQQQLRSKITVNRSRKGTITQQQPKLHLPPANDIAAKVYNIAPDTLTGWKPKLFLPRPVPLTFGYTVIDATLKFLQKPEKLKEPVEVCYLGPRQQNSYYLHMNKSYPFPYSHIKSPKLLGNSESGGVGLKFDSMFESGNLDCVMKISEDEYDLYMRPDTNTKGYLQWFNFKVKNAKRRMVYKFNICNFQKHRSLYNRGMKPFVYSEKTMQYKKIGWQQVGQNVKYEKKPGRYLAEQYSGNYRLSFEYEFEYAEDQVQFSYCVPYTYTQLLDFIQELKKNTFVKVGRLTNSLGSLEVPLLTITQDNPKKQAVKRCVIVSARTHPGETNSSYMMHGFLQFICGTSQQASFLRKNVIFLVVPMLNVDGVVAGNHRTGLSGKDFNRQFVNPDRYLLPEISALKDLVVKSKQIYGRNLIFFLDFHGHSFKKNVFIYGPEYPIRQNEYYECKIFPKMLGNETPMFRYYSCMFRISQCKETTARAILFKKLNIPFAYTLQASNGYYYDKDTLKNIMFNEKLWKQMGETIVKTIHKYCNELISIDLLRFQKQRAKRESAQIKLRNKSIENKRMMKQSVPNPIQKLTYKRPSVEIKAYETKTVTEEAEVVLPGSFRDIVQQIKKQQEIIKQNPQFQKDVSIGSASQSEESNDELPQEITQFIIKSVKMKKFQGLNAFSTYVRFSEQKMKSIEQQLQDTITSFIDSPTKKSIDLSPKKPHPYMVVHKSNSTKISLSKTTFPPSRSAQPRERERKSETVDQSLTEFQQKFKYRSRILNIETIRCKYLNVKGESLKRQVKQQKEKQKETPSNSFVDSFKKSYNYYKQKEMAPIFASDNLNRTFSRTTRKSYLFKEVKSSNYNSMLQQYI